MNDTRVEPAYTRELVEILKVCPALRTCSAAWSRLPWHGQDVGFMPVTLEEFEDLGHEDLALGALALSPPQAEQEALVQRVTADLEACQETGLGPTPYDHGGRWGEDGMVGGMPGMMWP